MNTSLKDSTFHINEVLKESIEILKKRYFSIATICFLLFIITTMSSVMSQFQLFSGWTGFAYKISGLIFTILLFFIFQLFLLKYILGIVDKTANLVFDKFLFPTVQQIIRAILSSLLFIVGILLSFIVVAIILFPLVNFKVLNLEDAGQIIAISGGILFVYFLVKISFYMFFIIDRKANPLKSILMSFAITKGNFLNILILYSLLLVLYGIFALLNYFNLVILSMVLNVLTSFVMVPLSSIVLTVAYRKMTANYKGEMQTDILENII